MRTLKEQVAACQLTCDWHQALTLIESLPVINGAMGRCKASERSDSSGNSMKSLEEAIDTGYLGWTDGARAARKTNKYGTYFGLAEQRQTTWAYSDEEGEFQTDRYMNGSSDYLLTFKNKKRFTQGLRIVVGIGASGSINSSTLNYQAILIAAHIAKLEQLRIPFELWAVSVIRTYSGDDWTNWTAMRLHRSGDMFNLGRLVYFCGHAAVLRRLVFALRERASLETQRMIGPDYGLTGTITAENFPRLQLPPWHGQTVVIGNVQTNDQQEVEAKVVKAFRTGYDRINKMLPVGGVAIF